MAVDKALQEEFEQIVKKHTSIETLTTRNSDSLDFHDLSVSTIIAIMEDAYQAGYDRSRNDEFNWGYASEVSDSLHLI